MKTVVIVAVILLTVALVFLVLPQYGIRTLPGRVEYISEPEPETVEYIARPPAKLGKQLLSPWVSEQSKESAWSNARGKWVVWKGNVHSIEPMLKPSRIVFLHEYEAPLPFYTERFGVIVEFDAHWSEHLGRLVTGDTVYLRAKLVERELAFADAYRYGLDFSSYVLLLEDAQIIDSNDTTAKLADLAYASYEQIDGLVVAAERINKVMNYFERRANVASDWRWQLSSFATQLVNIQLPRDPSLSGDDHSEVRKMSLVVVRREATLAKSEIERTFAAALTLLHRAGTSGDVDGDAIQHLTRTTERVQTFGISEDEIRYLESAEDKDRRLGQPSIEGLFLVLVASPFGIWVKIAAAVAEAAATVLLDLELRPVYEQMIVACETYLGTISIWLEVIREVNVSTISEITAIS